MTTATPSVRMSSPSPEARPPAAQPRRSTRRDATANRAALLEAAQRLLATDAAASLDSIAREAGLTRRALYGHFADRDELLHEVIALGAVRFNEIAGSTDHPDPRVALARLAVRLWREASVVRASANIALDDAHLQHTVVALAPLRRRVRDLVAAGAASGAFRGDVSPELLAFLVEETARSTVRALGAADDQPASVVASVVLSIVGLSWREQAELLAAQPEITAR